MLVPLGTSLCDVLPGKGLVSLQAGHQDIHRRLGEIERDMTQLKDQVDLVRERIGKVETGMTSLASKKDLHELSVILAKV